MIRLTRVELTRMRLRRAVLLLLGLGLLGPALLALLLTLTTSPIDDDDLARAQAQADAEAAQPYYQRELERCEQRPNRFGVEAEAGDVREVCEEYLLPRAEWFLEESPLELRGLYRDNVGMVVVLLAGGASVLAAITFAGHDWNTGSMGNQLLAEPRRLRVWLAKLIAVALASTLFASMSLLLFWGWLFAVAERRGISTGDTWVELIAYQSLRGVALIVAASMAGYGLAMLTRSTVASVGLIFVYAAVFPIIALVFAQLTLAPWTPQVNAFAYLKDGFEIIDYDSDQCYDAAFSGNEVRRERCVVTVSREQGGLALGGLSVLVLAGSAVSFGRRDVP